MIGHCVSPQPWREIDAHGGCGTHAPMVVVNVRNGSRPLRVSRGFLPQFQRTVDVFDRIVTFLEHWRRLLTTTLIAGVRYVDSLLYKHTASICNSSATSLQLIGLHRSPPGVWSVPILSICPRDFSSIQLPIRTGGSTLGPGGHSPPPKSCQGPPIFFRVI